MPEGEQAQERPQRRGRPHIVEQAAHAAVAQQVHVVDAVRARDHPADQREDLRGGVHPALRRDVHRSASNVANPHRAANPMTAASPAHDTRFGSSNRTDIARRA